MHNGHCDYCIQLPHEHSVSISRKQVNRIIQLFASEPSSYIALLTSADELIRKSLVLVVRQLQQWGSSHVE